MPTASVGIETSLKLALLHKADYKPSYGSKVNYHMIAFIIHMMITSSTCTQVQRSDVSTPPIHPVQVEVFGCTDCSTHAGMSVQALTHAQKVTRLYRKSLKHLLSWKIYRSAWRLEALDLRSIFDENKKIKDVAKATSLLEQGEACFNMWKHPDPYICKG